MPTCMLCPFVQAKLNPGDLCKTCFGKHNKADESSSDINRLSMEIPLADATPHERSIMELIRENMEQDKKRASEYTALLKEQIEYLKKDIDYKNAIIESLLSEVSLKNAKFNPTVNVSSNGLNECCNDETQSLSDKIDSRGTTYNSEYCKWQYVGGEYKNRIKSPKLNSSYTHLDTPNRYRLLVVDDDPNVENDVDDNNNIVIRNGNSSKYQNIRESRSNFYANNQPQNDRVSYKPTVPGNSSYADMTSSGKNICILSDSIC